jgi:hypothetical protein
MKLGDLDPTTLSDAQLLALIQALNDSDGEPIEAIQLLKAEIARRKQARGSQQ